MSQIMKAVLGPTNTGKTHFAIERMLSYSSGVMGFPLRLLAREVYDRVVRVKGKNQTALITGEERIIPEGARYFLCTVESMPRHKVTDFVAIDEVQMAADPMRGHVFTQHLLNTRGQFETLFLGADTIAPLIKRLLPEAEIVERPRLSSLTYTKPVKLRRLPRRSAIVAFSAADVYGLAELIRRDKGGAAIVMGALSPRTRNAQVAMYQSGEVDYMVATDAIGMGLNLDVDHIAFNDLVKFDGRTFRELTPAEAGQIAGRAGRFKRDGTFTTLSGCDPFDPMATSQIEDHNFDPLKAIRWRNTRLDYASSERLIRSLEKPTDVEGLSRQRDALDLIALQTLAKDEEIKAISTTPERVQLLWDVCQIPDFRKLGSNDHLSLMKKVYGDLTSGSGLIEEDLISRAVKRVDKVHGDIDTLADRLASVRVWTYISHRSNWLRDASHWAHVTRGVEDKLSDALHERLTQRFVDRRTSVLMKSLKQKDQLRVEIDKDTGRVTVEGHELGTLKGFSFEVDQGAARDDQKTLTAAAETGLRMEISRRAKLFANVGFKTLQLDLTGGVAAPRLTLNGDPIFALAAEGGPLSLKVRIAGQTLLTSEEEALVLTKAQEWMDERIADKLEKLVALSKELNGEVETPEGVEALSGLARGIAYRLLENYGTLNRSEIDQELRQLDQEARKGLRRFGIRFGATSLYMPLILKPHATELRLVMWALHSNKEDLPVLPTPGMVWVETAEGAPEDFYTLAGFRYTERKAVRMDMLERLADAVRPLGSNGDWFPVTPEIMGLVGLSGQDFAAVMQSLGYGNEARMEPKPAPEQPTEPKEAGEEATAEAVAEAAGEAAPEASSEAPAHDTPAETDASAATEQLEADQNGSDSAKDIKADAPKETPEEETPAPEESTPSEEAPAVEEPAAAQAAQATEMDAASTVEAAGEAAGEAATETTGGPADETVEEAELVERFYFKWQPKRRAQQRPRSNAKSEKRDGEKGPRRQRNANQSRANKFAGNPKGRSKPAQSGGGNKGADGQARSNKRAPKQADPDSPFAALAGLKDALERKK